MEIWSKQEVSPVATTLGESEQSPSSRTPAAHGWPYSNPMSGEEAEEKEEKEEEEEEAAAKKEDEAGAKKEEEAAAKKEEEAAAPHSWRPSTT